MEELKGCAVTTAIGLLLIVALLDRWFQGFN